MTHDADRSKYVIMLDSHLLKLIQIRAKYFANAIICRQARQCCRSANCWLVGMMRINKGRRDFFFRVEDPEVLYA